MRKKMAEYIPKKQLVKKFRRLLDEMPAADVVSRAAFEQMRWERDIAMKQLEEHGIPFGGKAEGE